MNARPLRYAESINVDRSADRSPAASEPLNNQFLRAVAPRFINCPQSLLSIGIELSGDGSPKGDQGGSQNEHFGSQKGDHLSPFLFV
jgi:hypothetical protein